MFTNSRILVQTETQTQFFASSYLLSFGDDTASKFQIAPRVTGLSVPCQLLRQRRTSQSAPRCDDRDATRCLDPHTCSVLTALSLTTAHNSS